MGDNSWAVHARSISKINGGAFSTALRLIVMIIVRIIITRSGEKERSEVSVGRTFGKKEPRWLHVGSAPTAAHFVSRVTSTGMLGLIAGDGNNQLVWILAKNDRRSGVMTKASSDAVDLRGIRNCVDHVMRGRRRHDAP